MRVSILKPLCAPCLRGEVLCLLLRLLLRDVRQRQGKRRPA